MYWGCPPDETGKSSWSQQSLRRLDPRPRSRLLLRQEEPGHGGFGTVFRANDTTLDRTAAFKILDPVLSRDDEWAARFRRETLLDYSRYMNRYEVSGEYGQLFIIIKLIDRLNIT
ncbi:MAG: hypothetical protein JXA42_08390 [Anaerolineales bacterium]|nr:hypothetical protein [Anaerolineales bacterium]